MARNVGNLDALIRAALALLLVAFGVLSHQAEIVSFAAVLLGIILMGTALTRECPVYRALHIGSRRRHHPYRQSGRRV
jgi:hypothetical protein